MVAMVEYLFSAGKIVSRPRGAKVLLTKDGGTKSCSNETAVAFCAVSSVEARSPCFLLS